MIINAYIKKIEEQEDDRKYITEIQVDDVLGEQEFLYLAEKGTDINKIMTDRTINLNS